MVIRKRAVKEAVASLVASFLPTKIMLYDVFVHWKLLTDFHSIRGETFHLRTMLCGALIFDTRFTSHPILVVR